MHLAITDSGLGGLSVCAAIERAWRDTRRAPPLRISYVNAWPEEGRGYNDFPDVPTRAAVFDRALDAIEGLAPDRIVIACNTLSVLFDETNRKRRSDGAPVQGIIDAGVAMFDRALRNVPGASLVLVGTKTTIESGVHRDALLARGVAAERVTSASCHGLATAIENSITDESTTALIERCAERAAATLAGGGQVFLGLCCTHYGMAARQLVDALAARVTGGVTALDPNAALVGDVLASLPDAASPPGDAESGTRAVPTISVVSKVSLPESKRENVAAILASLSPATSEALRHYTHVPELF